MANEIFEGKVKYWNQSGAWGFIETDQEDLFVHISDISGHTKLIIGESVSFEYGTHNGKPVAKNVERI
jgi:cold shock CspA family protein